MCKVSILVPIYNVEKYLRQCLDSVVNQTLQDIEIICINDGSTDSSPAIINEYAAKDSRIKVINKPNSGYGHSMNQGLKLAQGEYIGIVETDDYIESYTYEILYNEIYKTNTEYIKGKTLAFFDQEDFKYQFPMNACPDWETKNKVVVNPSRYPWLLMCDTFVWNGIYRRTYFSKFQFRETPGAAFQDIGKMFQLISNAREAIYLNKVVYHYRQGDILASSYNHKSLNYVQDEYAALERLLPDLPAGWIYAYYRNMAGHILNRFTFMASEGIFWVESERSIIWLQEKIRYALNNNILHRENFELDKWEQLLLFLKDAKLLFRHNQMITEQHVNITLNTVKQFKDCELIIFGCGAIGKKVAFLLHLLGFGSKLIAFCDNSTNNQGKIIDNLKVLSPDQAVENYKNAYFFVASKSHYKDIKYQLLQMGVNENSIYAEDFSEKIFVDVFTLQILYRQLKNIDK